MQVEQLLPNRKPWVLIDKIVDVLPLKKIITVKNISTSDYFLKGHFPSYSVYPGVLLLEGLKQSSELLLRLSSEKEPFTFNDFSQHLFITSMDARFLLPVRPGEKIEYIVEIKKYTDTMFEFYGEGLITGKIAIRGKMKGIVVN